MRARLLAQIRRFFAAREVIEVETPILARSTSCDPAIESFRTGYNAPGNVAVEPLFLQTSPEFFMKRLLAAGTGAIYQIARVFRDAESGRRHNPEFTMLEWYRPGFDHHRLMDEVEALLCELFPANGAWFPVRRLSYRQLFLMHAGLDPFRTTVAGIRAWLGGRGIRPPDGLAEDSTRPWLELALSHCIEPEMDPGALFVYDYPADQAALARVRDDEPPVAERFELYLGGMELANGFHELTDPVEQSRRFALENRVRCANHQAPVPLDGHLLQALQSGLPDCAGVALGIDRLLMIAAGLDSIDQAVTFGFARV